MNAQPMAESEEPGWGYRQPVLAVLWLAAARHAHTHTPVPGVAEGDLTGVRHHSAGTDHLATCKSRNHHCHHSSFRPPCRSTVHVV